MNILVAENEIGEISEEHFMILVELFDNGLFCYDWNKALAKKGKSADEIIEMHGKPTK
jgi:hypothetical protein